MGKVIISLVVGVGFFIAGMIVAKITNGLTSRNNGHGYNDDGGYDDDDYDSEDYEDDEDNDEGGEEEEEEYFYDEHLTIGDEEGITDYFGVRHIDH